ncbi:MAG TPA: hypothetical protein VKD22_12915 [Ramlibacter sp.]|nr:hypothetical protein [Ramlibacter sp.]
MAPDQPQSERWVLAHRAQQMNPSVIREILKVTERPGIISFAGGLPSPKTFPVEEFAVACEKVLRGDGRGALQYAASEGYGPLREMVAAMLPWKVDPAQVLITTGSQQGLDLVAKILVDAGDLDVQWNTPSGGMFIWARLPPGIDSARLLPQAVERGVAFVPGATFFAGEPDPRCMRLSFVTASREQIDAGVAALAAAIRVHGAGASLRAS